MSNNEELDALVGDWLTVPDLMEALGAELREVHRLLDQRQIVAVKRGENKAVSVPAAFLEDGKIVDALTGTITVLGDAGYTDAEMIAWLFTADETLPGTPMQALREGRKTEIRRRAQALAW